MLEALPFAQIWLVDFEFIAGGGENPDPVCLVAYELRSGRKVRVWREDMRIMPLPPYPTGPEALFIAFYAALAGTLAADPTLREAQLSWQFSYQNAEPRLRGACWCSRSIGHDQSGRLSFCG